jgi:hypothetical protein
MTTETPEAITLSSGTTYQAAPEPTPFEMADLFAEVGSPLQQPSTVATSIRFVMMKYRPESWERLAGHLGVSVEKLRHASFCLEMINSIRDCGAAALNERFDLIAEQTYLYNQKAIIKATREHYGKDRDEHGFCLPSTSGSTKYHFPSDHTAPAQPNAAAKELIAAIERVKPINWDDLSIKLDCGIADLMAFCKLLAREYSIDRLSMRSLHEYFEAQASLQASINSKLTQSYTPNPSTI